MVKCPNCGSEFDPDATPEADPVDELAASFAAECAAKGYTVRAGKVSETVAAKLLAYEKRAFAKLRKSGNGPAYYYFTITGSTYAYTLKELAAYQFAQQIGESWM
ncbi:hypothetical protein [Rhodanobacter lindaniclasticus]